MFYTHRRTRRCRRGQVLSVVKEEAEGLSRLAPLLPNTTNLTPVHIIERTWAPAKTTALDPKATDPVRDNNIIYYCMFFIFFETPLAAADGI